MIISICTSILKVKIYYSYTNTKLPKCPIISKITWTKPLICSQFFISLVWTKTRHHQNYHHVSHSFISISKPKQITNAIHNPLTTILFPFHHCLLYKIHSHPFKPHFQNHKKKPLPFCFNCQSQRWNRFLLNFEC